MKSCVRHIMLWLLAAMFVVAPGLDWSFVTMGSPPLKWQNASGAELLITDRVPIGPEDFYSAVRNAASAWDGHAKFAFYYGGVVNQQYGADDGLNVFDYLGFPDSPDTPGQTIPSAYPGDPSSFHDVDSTLNFSAPLSTGIDPFAYDVQSVAVHELGHWLFLDNTDLPGTVMYAYLELGEIRRALSQDDIDGIRYLYPDGGGSAGGGGGRQVCFKVARCETICREEETFSIALVMRKREIESLDFSQLQTVMLQRPRPRALLFAILNDLPELEHVAMNFEDEIMYVWEPVTDDWVPGLYWLSGDSSRGQNLVLTSERAAALIEGIEVIQHHSGWRLRRDLDEIKRFIRTHRGRTLEEMRAELFDNR